ncbi:MAG: hypothetical protein M0Z64_04530 [Nitrospiraceae bacterium]|nr:hypothetical protein [Nitrospiraceae bacterium]
MREVKYIIYRRLTTTDFFNMYKPKGSEKGGGGQSYIDIPYSAVPFEAWEKFFKGIKYEKTKSGPLWRFKINSIGFSISQELEIGQRRAQTFNIRGQKITSREANRVKAWHPDNGFPQPIDPSKRQHIDNLVIYILRTMDDEYWAGWFQDIIPCKTEACENILASMLDKGNGAGFLEIPEGILQVDVKDKITPFSTISGSGTSIISEDRAVFKPISSKKKQKALERQKKIIRQPRPEEEVLKVLFDEDENYKPGYVKERLVMAKKIRARNQRASNVIKELYKGKCQISGEEFAFKKKDGTLYAEVHHLVLLGEGGADSPFNLIVVNPLIHRMLHYADVNDIDLSKIEHNKLTIKINGQNYTITWHEVGCQ